MLTKLEDQILMTVWKFKDEAYGVNIYQHLNGIIQSKVAMGVVYANLDRLVRKGYLQAYLGEPTAVRGGMRKKYFRITDSGLQQLSESKKVHDQIWEGFPEAAVSKRRS